MRQSRFRRPLAFLLLCWCVLAFAPASDLAEPAAAAKVATSLPVDAGQEKALLRVAGAGAKIHRTPHFLIASNAAPSLVNDLSARLERTFESVDRFCVKNGFVIKPLGRRLEVLFFDTFSDYQKYSRTVDFRCEGTYGFYYERTNISTFFNVESDPQLVKLHKEIDAARANVAHMESTLKSIRGPQPIEIVYPDGRRARMNKTQAHNELEGSRRELKSLDIKRQDYCDRVNRTVLQHEVAHQVLYNTGLHVRGGANPKWLVEGLACIFETPPSSDGAGLGAINQARLKDFRTALAGADEAKSANTGSYAAAVKGGRIVSVKDLICRPELFEQRGDRGATNYAAAWGLVYYLHRVQNKALPGYLQAVAERRPGEVLSPAQELDLFQKHFGPVNEAFAGRYSSFILGLAYKPSGGL